MLVAIPVDAFKRLYHHNPCSAAVFDLYDVTGDKHDVRYRHVGSRLNPWERYNGNMVRDPAMKACECECALTQNPLHISEHYVLLQALGRCDVLIAGNYCLNTLYAMKNVGIKIHKVPPFIKSPPEAIEHFIIGSGLTRYLGCVHAE